MKESRTCGAFFMLQKKQLLKILVFLCMGQKHHFRKMHFICYKNRIINQFLTFVNAYRDRKTAEEVLDAKTVKRDFTYLWEKPEDLISNEKVESFYLVHESLYEKILKEHDIDAK